MAATMGRYAQRVPPQMVLALGDNIYETGVEVRCGSFWSWDAWRGVYVGLLAG